MTRYGSFKFHVMPFGLTNAPTIFYHIINQVICDCLNDFVVAYLDDIVFFSESLEDHIVHLRKVQSRFMEHQLYVKLENVCLTKRLSHSWGI